MSFLQSALLYGLPLALLPVIIHLINQYRHRTVKWGAMQFLLKAKRMNKGFARLRQILILAMRVLAVAALIFAVARPLASGWVGLAAGGKAETAIIILDRSASMEQADPRSGESKRETALRKVADLLANLGDRSRVVLIESAHSAETLELDSAKNLLKHSEVGPTATSADIPAMLSTALDYLTTNESGSADIWICSDRSEADWDKAGGRWEGLRSGFSSIEAPVRFYLLNYSDVAEENLSVRATNITRRDLGDRAELVMDVKVRGGVADQETRVPLSFIVNGTRTVSDITVTGGEYSLQGHVIPLDQSVASGWGRVELPADLNPMDDTSWFVFAESEVLKTAIVSDNDSAFGPMETAVGVGPDTSRKYTAEVFRSERVAEIDWENTALILWQTALPDADSVALRQLEKFVSDGKTILFFAPDGEGSSGAEAFGYRWGDWVSVPEGGEPFRMGTWRQDAGLLSDTRSGEPLPIGETRIFRHRLIVGETGSPLAKLASGTSVIVRANTDRGSAYFCGVLPQSSDSSLARDGVVFYVMMHRALAEGAAALSGARMVNSGVGALGDNPLEWMAFDEKSDHLHHELHAGAYQRGENFRAVNRPESEDDVRVLDDTAIDELFEGLDILKIDDVEGEENSLVSEIWRAFLIAVALALVAEAILCLPEKRAPRKPEPEEVAT